MTQGTLKIHSENILPIIKKWLYSDRDIFLRELVSNACDAMSKLKILRDQSETTFVDNELRIDMKIDKENKTLTISDTGLGMSAEEVEKYIAQLAFSGAEEFMSKYEGKSESDQIIGHFGLGFYSAFMVSEKVTIDTLSYREGAKAAFWTCDGSSDYTMEEGKRETRGTTIVLHISDEEFLEETKISEILKKYCSFLPFPIYLGEKRINEKEPLWMKNPADCTDEEYLEFYRHLHPFEPDPIFWVHLNVDYPFNLKGILYFPKLNKRFDFNKNTLELYCNRVFVSDNCKDLIPDFLTVLRGVIDSPDIPLNVSRSYLQMDRTVRQLSTHIAKKVADKLAALEKEKFTETWPDIEMIVKLGVLQDEKFYDRVKSQLIWKNTSSEWTNIEDYLDRNKEKAENKVFYMAQVKADDNFLQMYREKGIEILQMDSHLDTPIISFLEQKVENLKFQRLDGALDDLILDADREKSTLDSDGKSLSAKTAENIKSLLDREQVEVEAKSLSSNTLPAFVLFDEQARRMRDTLALSQQDMPGDFLKKRTFVVNTNSPLIAAIEKHKDRDLAKKLVCHLYDLSLLSQNELEPEKVSSLISTSTDIFSTLME
jgi:molecular chaperone HtpG